MAYFHNVHLVTLLLLVALAPQLYGIDVTEEMIEGTLARPIGYRASEDWDELINIYISVVTNGQQPLQGVPAYSVQTTEGQAPPFWVPIDVVGRDEKTDRTRLLIRGDNGYLIGFTNWTGHYHLLKGPDQNLIPEATYLDIGLRYTDLLGEGGRKNLPDLPLSEDLFLDASHNLGTFPACSEEEMKKSVATFVVMICEASRLKPIRQRISENWGVGVCYIDDMQSKYTVEWALMSLLLLCDDEGIALSGTDARELRKNIGVITPEDVKGILGLALRPRRFDPNDAQESCKPIDKRKKKPPH